jgi:hypothetical protein
MKTIIYILLGLIVVIVAYMFFFQTLIDNVFYDNSTSIKKNIKDNDGDDYEDQDDDDGYIINRVVYFNNKLAIKLSSAEIKASNIVVSKLKKGKILINEDVNSISIEYKNLFNLVNKYDLLEIELGKKKINKEYIEKKYLRLKSLYEEQGSIALKDLEEENFILQLIKSEFNSIKKNMDFLMSEIKLLYGNIIVDDILSKRQIFNSLINNHSSLLIIENIDLDLEDNKYKFNNEELIFLNTYNGNSNLRGNVGMFFLKNKKISTNRKVIVTRETEEWITGYLIPKSSLVYHDGKVWAYFKENDEIFSKTEISNFYIIDDKNVLTNNEIVNLNIVVFGAQTLLAEEFRSQIMQEDDD